MHQANVSRIESGAVVPSAATLDRLLAAMNGGGPVLAPVRPDRWRELPTTGQLHELDVAAMMGGEPEAIDWIVEGMIARKAVTMLAGKEGQGKSLVCQALAVGIVQDRRNVAGLQTSPGRVWIVDAENGPQLLHRRLVKLGLDRAGASRIRIWDANSFDLSRDRGQLIEELRRVEHRPDLLVLDSFKSLWHGSESNPAAVSDVLNELRAIAREFDLGIVLIHHTTKTGDTYRGSSAIGGTIEAVFTFARPRGLDYESSDLRVLKCRKMRLGAEAAVRWVRIENGRIVRAEPPEEG